MKKLLIPTLMLAAIVATAILTRPEPAYAATGGTTNTVAAWDLISGPAKPIWQRMFWERLMVQCATVYAEPESTPNHRARMAWVQQFWPYLADPIQTLPVTSLRLIPQVIAQPDVAFVIASGSQGDDSLVGALDGIVTNNCPPPQ